MKILIASNNPAKVREIQAALADGQPGISSVQWASLSDLESPIPEPEEAGASFLENATLKATYYARLTGLWALADDSGLEVDALHGQPGVHSAYFDRTAAHLPRAQRDAANNAKLVAAMSNVPPQRRTARYHCVMVLASPTSLLPGTKHSPPGSMGLRPVRTTTPTTNADGVPTGDAAPTDGAAPPTSADAPPTGDDATGDVRVLATAHGLFEGLIINEPRGAGGFGYDPYFLIPDLQKTAAELPAEEKNRISHRGKALRAMSEQIRGLLGSGR